MIAKSLLLSNAKAISLNKKLAASVKGDFNIIDHYDAFQELLNTTDLYTLDYCFILVELKWQNRVYIQHYGFEIAKKIRQNGFRGIIYFLSLFPKTTFSARHSLYALLRVPEFHVFQQLPNFPKLPALPPKMSAELLEDIQLTLLDNRSLIRELMHDLKNAVTIPENANEATSIDTIKCAIRKKFIDLKSLLPNRKTEIKALETALYSDLEELKKSKSNVQDIIEKYTLEILKLSPKEEQLVAELAIPRPQWKVLFVDDDVNIINYLSAGFENNNIDYIGVSSSKEVLEILRKDNKNKICVLICDLRLKNAETEIWDVLQGADLMKKIYEEYANTLAFFALSSARSRLLRLKRNYKLNVFGYYKNDVLSSMGALNIFIEKVRYVGAEKYFQSRSQPTGKSWWQGGEKHRFYQPLAYFYRDHIIDSDYELVEKQINALAKDYIDNAIEGKANKAIEFTITIKKDKDKLTGLEKFRNHILLGRRIAIGLYLNDFDEVTILQAMQPQSDAKNIKAMQKFLFNTTLAISFKKDFPHPEDIQRGHYLKSNLLLEEIEWAINTFNTDFDLNQMRINQNDWNILSQVLENWQSRLRQFSVLKGQEKEYNKMLSPTFVKGLRAKNFKQKFKDAFTLAKCYKFEKAFKEDLAFDIEEIENNQIREQLKTYLE